MSAPVKTWRFSEPNRKGEGWWIAFLDEAGALAVLSDFGDYAYRWHPGALGEPNLVRFLARVDSDYVLRKVSPREDHLDCAATEMKVREAIVEEVDDAASDDVSINSERDLFTAVSDFGLDGSDVAVYRRDPQAVAFIERVWPRIVAQLQAAIARGEA